MRSTLSAVYPERAFTLVFGVLRDKAIGEMTEILFPIAERVIVTHANNPRSATPSEVREASLRTAAELIEAESVDKALEEAQSLVGPSVVVVVTGSIYIVGEAMRMLGVSI